MLQCKKTNFHKSVAEISKSQFSFDKSIFDNFSCESFTIREKKSNTHPINHELSN